MTEFDVAIIGGGPAGAATGAYLAKAGVRCVILERESFPRPHVGESLVPSTTRVFKELGFLRKMEEAGFQKKFGAVWTTAHQHTPYAMDLEGLEPSCRVDILPLGPRSAGGNRNYTFHVDRARFDHMLLQHAASLGACVREGAAVQGVDFDEAADPQVRLRKGKLKARFVVDASGRRTLLGSQLGLKRLDPVFDQFALHTWFDGFDRGPVATANHIFIHFLPRANTWVWQIPITCTVTSIGVVTQRRHFSKSRAGREKFFWDCLGTRPDVAERLKAATPLRPLKEEGDYSYAMSRVCGERFVLVGDAARFVDPIFSSGVGIALNSARFASKDILGALESADFSRKSFRRFEETTLRGLRNWHQFILLYYRLNVLFTRFVQDPRYRLDIIRLLQGDVYDEVELPALTEMRRQVSLVEQDKSHPWHGLLGDLTADAFKPGLSAPPEVF